MRRASESAPVARENVLKKGEIIMRSIPSIVAIIAVTVAAPAAAQDIGADPTYETVRLNAGFADDPYTVRISSGGLTDASNLGNGCRGYIATRPDVRLHYQAGEILPLILSATSDVDTTIVVNAPDGSWYCDDDSGGSLNPMVRFEPALSGRYEIWVGTYGEADNHPATVNISELYGPADSIADTSSVSFTPGGGTTGPDISADPIFETVRLSAGFAEDPYIVSLTSGGSNDASAVGSECRGYISSRPDVRLHYESGDTLPLILSVNSGSDTTLVVNAPDGNWYCDDDGGDGLNPSLQFDTPLAGRYEIWVGSYGDNASASADLHISELYSQ